MSINGWRNNGPGVYYAYILQLDRGYYYVGQTDDLRSRMVEHRDGLSKTTSGRKPVLKYFEIVESRGEAEKREKELWKLVYKDRRKVCQMATEFNDLVSEVGR